MPYIPLDNVPHDKGAVYIYAPNKESLQTPTPIGAIGANGQKTYLGKLEGGKHKLFYATAGTTKFSNISESIFGNGLLGQAMSEAGRLAGEDYCKELIMDIEAGKKYCVKVHKKRVDGLKTKAVVFEKISFWQCEYELRKTIVQE